MGDKECGRQSERMKIEKEKKNRKEKKEMFINNCLLYDNWSFTINTRRVGNLAMVPGSERDEMNRMGERLISLAFKFGDGKKRGY